MSKLRHRDRRDIQPSERRGRKSFCGLSRAAPVSDGAAAQRPGAPQVHAEVPGNSIYDWVIGDKAATDAAFKAAAHVTRLTIVNNRLIPNAMEPRAAVAEFDAGNEHHHFVDNEPKSACGPSRPFRLRQLAPEHKLRVIAPDVGGGFGSKIFIYPEEVVCLGRRKVGAPVKWTADARKLSHRRHGRDHVTHAELASTRTTNSWPAGQDHRQSGRLYVDLLFGGADLSLCDPAVRPIRHPVDPLRGGFGLYQHRSGRRLSRRRAAGSHLCGRAPG